MPCAGNKHATAWLSGVSSKDCGRAAGTEPTWRRGGPYLPQTQKPARLATSPFPQSHNGPSSCGFFWNFSGRHFSACERFAAVVYYLAAASSEDAALWRSGEMSELAEGARLEIVYAPKAYPGFESPSLRHENLIQSPVSSPFDRLRNRFAGQLPKLVHGRWRKPCGHIPCGGVAEWLNAAVSKNRFTRNPGNEGSNPSSSASAKHEVRRLSVWPFRFWYICWHAKRHGFGENASNAGSAIERTQSTRRRAGGQRGRSGKRETETRGAGASRHWRGRTRQDGKQGAGARGQARPRPHQQALARANASPWRRTRSGTSKSALKCASVSRSSFLPVANIRPDFTNTRRSISGMMSSG